MNYNFSYQTSTSYGVTSSNRVACPHVELLQPSAYEELDLQNVCRTCGDKNHGWICLHCYEVFCTRGNGHMKEHVIAKGHNLTLSYKNLYVWCYVCRNFVMHKNLVPIINHVQRKSFASFQRKLNDLENLSLDLHNLLSNERLPPDVEVRCGELITPAHRTVLAARSEVFADMLRNNMAENQIGVIEIADVDMPTFELLLQFAYAGKIELPSVDSAMRLYSAADRYIIPYLKKHCSDYMIRNFTTGNCLSLLELSEKYGDEGFEGFVLTFIANNLDGLKREDWSSFKDACPQLAMKVYEKRLAILSEQVDGQNSKRVKK